MTTKLIDVDPNLVSIAKKIPYEKRASFIRGLNEPQLLTPALVKLFGVLESDYYVENTHGMDELGKDIVIIKEDKITTDVIGVVVVRGDIKGTTIGDVDDLIKIVKGNFNKGESRLTDKIISQVNSAIASGASLSSILKELPINRIIVVIAGTISPTGKQRIRNQVENPSLVEFKDIKWLVDNFTKNYPQIFLQPDTIDFINEKIKTFNQPQNPEKTSLSLTDYFVEPLISTIEIPQNLEDIDITKSLNRKLPFSQLKTLVRDNKKILLIGEPGTGKTGAIHKYALDILAETYQVVTDVSNTNIKCKVPIIVKARDLYTIFTTSDLLTHFCGKLLETQTPEVEVLLIDGIDEIPPLFRDEILDKATMIADELECPVIITSRKIDYVDAPPKGFKKVEVLPFELGQALQLFERLMGQTKAFKSLKRELERSSRRIPMVPLSLHLLVKIVEDHNEIPSSITELYDRFMDAVLGKYDSEKGIEVLYEYKVKKRFLAALAYDEFLNKSKLEGHQNPTEISIEQFHAFTTSHAETFGYVKGKLDDFINEVERAGIIEINKVVKFSHRSFMDYFVAWHIFDNSDEIENLTDVIVNLYFDDVWTDAAFYYVGLRSKLSATLLQRIFDHDQKLFSAKLQKYMIGRLLQAGWNSPTKTKTEGIIKGFSIGTDIHGDLRNYFSKYDVQENVSTLIPDIIFLSFAEMSFRSGVLSKEIKEFYESLESGISLDEFYQRLTLLWCFYPFVEDELERESIINKLLTQVSGAKLSPADKARMVLLVSVLGKGEVDNIRKIIDRQVKRVVSKSPGISKLLLPVPKESVNNKPRKRRRNK